MIFINFKDEIDQFYKQFRKELFTEDLFSYSADLP